MKRGGTEGMQGQAGKGRGIRMEKTIALSAGDRDPQPGWDLQSVSSGQ